MNVIKYFVIAVLALAGLVTTIHLIDSVLKTKSTQIVDIDPYNIPLVDKLSIYIKKYQIENSHLPDRKEVKSWMDNNDNNYESRGYSYEKAPFHTVLDHVFEAPTNDAFILNYWNGNFFVVYAPWFRDGKQVYIPDSEYFHFGSQLADCFIFLIIFIMIIRIISTLLKK